MFTDYKISKKSKLDKLKDDIWSNYYRKFGVVDTYYLGQISVIEVLVDNIDKEYSIALLNNIKNSDTASKKIIKIVDELLKEYKKETKIYYKGEF